jgi:hypothetical protein
MAKKRTKKRLNSFRHPIIGKYIDTPTKAELPVIYFIDDVGNYKLQIGTLPTTVLKSCRFQIKTKNVKSQKRFYKKLRPYLDFSAAREWMEGHGEYRSPSPLFGLLKIRKGKIRKFVLITSASQFYGSDVVNLIAVYIDNLLYLDLLGGLKNKKP